MLIVEEVPRVDLVDRDRPQRGQVVVAQVFELTLLGPRRIDVGQIVVGATRFDFGGPRRQHARERPAVEVWRRGDGNRFARWHSDERLALEKRLELVQLLPPDRNELARSRMILFRFRPGRYRIAAIASTGQRLELFLG